jgi:hypothetical protein
VEGVGGREEANRLSEGETRTVLRRMKSGVGASFDRFASEKPGRGIGNTSELLFDNGRDRMGGEYERIGESDPNDDVEEEAECENDGPSRLDDLELTDFLAVPTGKRVIGRSVDSRR